MKKKLGRPKSEYAKRINSLFSEGSERTKARRVVEMKALSLISSACKNKGLIKDKNEIMNLFPEIYNSNTYNNQLFYFFGRYIVFTYDDDSIYYFFDMSAKLIKGGATTEQVLKWLRQQIGKPENKEAVRERYKRQIVSILEKTMVEEIIPDELFGDSHQLEDFMIECIAQAKENQFQKAKAYLDASDE